MNERNEWTDWSVLVEFVVEHDEPMDVWVEDVLEILADYAPVLSAEKGRVSVRLSVEHEDVFGAGNEAGRLVNDALAKFGLDPGPIVHLEISTPEELDAQLSQPTIPVLLGVAELAEMLDVTKQRASELANTGTFPRPVAELASGRVWVESTVQRFIEEWTRRPGRPRRIRAGA